MVGKIDILTWLPLKWKPIQGKHQYFECRWFKEDECYLKINDFPDEPLWTLYFKSKILILEDTPLLWKITYLNKTTSDV